MIFSQIFSPKHKSNQPEVRLASIEQLNKDVDKDRSILHELAFNDSNENVSLAALNKLNSFALWVKTAETSASVRIKKCAQEMCLVQLEDSSQVSDKLFIAFVQESKNKPFLEQMLFSSSRLQKNKPLALEVLQSLNNPVQTRRFFQEFASEEQQMSIIEKINDAKALNRFIKHAKDESIAARINDKLAYLADVAQKPIKIKQQVTMINSRLLALKEAQDYEYMSEQLTQLSGEFEFLKKDFACLDELSSAVMTEKYLGLKVDVQQKLAKLEEAYQSQNLLKQTTNELSDIQERCAQVKTQIDLISGQSEGNENVSSNIDAEVKILKSALLEAKQELDELKERAQTQAHRNKVTQLNLTISTMQSRLDQVFDIIEYANQGRQIEMALGTLVDNIDNNDSNKISQVDFSQFTKQIKTHKNAFDDLKSVASGLVPANTINNFAKTHAKAMALSKRMGRQFKELEDKCENKLRTVNRMIKDGRFKPAMSTFYQAKKLYDKISEHAPARIQRYFEQTHEDISKLEDWQAYIAQPRKPALLEKAHTLAQSQFEDPYERAEQVKQLRQEWNSLGSLNTPEDEAQSEVFDAYIEKAFVPCRAFFAELERQRELNYEKALSLVEEAKGLSSELPASELTAKISALKGRFNKLGDIDKSKVNKVRREFTRVFKPLSVSISKEQERNAEDKQALVKQASKLNEESTSEEVLPEAIEKAKALQQKWKQIGFAGKTADNQLWQLFRKANDGLFERYHISINDKKAAAQQELAALDANINSILKKIKAAKELSELQFFDLEYDALTDSLKTADAETVKRVQAKLRKMEEAYSSATAVLNRKRDESALTNLFTYLHSNGEEFSLDKLIGRHKAWIRGDIKLSSFLEGLNRVELTQAAAITFDIAFNDVPIGDKKVRQELQLKMMASKLQGEDMFDSESVLAKWVSLGPVTADEQESLQAMQKMFIG